MHGQQNIKKKVHFNVFLPSLSRFSRLCLASRFTHRNPVCIFFFIVPFRATCPAHLIVLDLITQMSDK